MSNQQMNQNQTTCEMKDSGVAWIGEIPSEWTVSKLKFIANDSKYSIVDGPFGSAISTNDYVDSGVPLIRITNLKGTELSKEDLVYIRHEKATSLLRSSIKFEDIIFAKTGATVGKCSLNSTLDFGILASSCVKITINKGLVKRYFLYLFKTSEFQRSLIQGCGGSTRDTINLTPFKNLYCVIPPLHEQKAIATYLDEQVEKMDGLISEQKQAIEKWKAYKQSLITEAVTKGLNPEVEMKDSGIEWIGEIPKEWEINKIKHCCYLKGRIGWQGLKSDEFIDDGPFLVTGTDFKNGVVNWETCRHISMERYEEAFQIQLKNDDMLVTKDGTIGKVALVKGLETKASLNSGVFLVRNIKNSYATKYLYYVMLSEVFWKYFKLTQNGSSTIVHLYQEIYKEFSFPFPEKHIQQAIAVYLDGKCLKIDQTIEQKELLIKQLEEYKQSLIYECVTGKRWVR